MLYLQRLTWTKAAAPELRRAILANSLVNLRGRQDFFFEADRLVELHNGNMKMLLAAKCHASFDVHYVFRNFSLNSSYFEHIRNVINNNFGSKGGSAHPPKGAGDDIWDMANKLQVGFQGNSQWRPKETALDLMHVGVRKMVDAIPAFNQRGRCLNLTEALLGVDKVNEDEEDAFLEENDADDLAGFFYEVACDSD
jgi:hypothetical protein